MRQPDSYTDHEGGEWKPWPEDLDVNTLRLDKYTEGINNIVVGTKPNVIKIHSILWHLAEGLYARWDTINHWTHSLDELHPTHQFLHKKSPN